MTERVFMTTVINAATGANWLVFHDEDSRRNIRGFPDLVIARGTRTIFAELKSERGKERSEQKVWLATLRSNPALEVYLWRPSDLPDILELLGYVDNPYA